ncbi:MAG TPA: hypothetical protein VFZ53_33405 [Polyangiaceae bacterium]
MKLATVAATVALSSSLATHAIADERQVVVLNLRGNASLQPWPEGTRAVIAELSASDDLVLVRPSSSSTFAALMGELEKASTEEQTVGAVCVGKSGSAGIAYVWVNGGASAIRVEDDLREGAVAEGAVALRVTEILHVRNIELPGTKREKKATSAEPVKPPPAPPPEPERGPPAFTTWLGAGLLTSSDASGPVPTASFGARVPIRSIFALEGAATGSFGWLKVTTDAGRAEVSMQSLTLHAVLDPWAEAPASLSLGFGGGAAFASQLGSPSPGYAGLYDSTIVGLVSARFGGALRGEHLSLVVHAEPGLLVPAVTLNADGRRLAELGRPWFSAMLGLGFSP